MPYLQGNAALKGKEKLKLIVNKLSDEKTELKALSEDFINTDPDLLE